MLPPHESFQGKSIAYFPHLDAQVAHAVNLALAADLAEEQYHVIDPGIATQPYDYDKASLDLKKVCPFCGRAFLHPGLLGRHLDLKKGLRLHPREEIERMRSNVKRRGDRAEVVARRKARAAEYNAREDVRERNRSRRKAKEKANKTRDEQQTLFLARLGRPSLGPEPSFARMVVYFMAPGEWPRHVPDEDTRALLERLLTPESGVFAYGDMMEKAYARWREATAAEREAEWRDERLAAVPEALENVSLFDLATRDVLFGEVERGF